MQERRQILTPIYSFSLNQINDASLKLIVNAARGKALIELPM